MYTEGEYLAKNRTWHTEDSPLKAQHVLSIVRRNNLDIKTVCEVGCGAGEILVQLLNQMPGDVRFYGYDISPQAIALCRNRQQDRLEFRLVDFVEEIDIHYDLVMLIDVFEHVENYYGFLKKIRDKGTYKIFHIPLDLSAQTVLRSTPILRARENVGHIHYFTKDTALASLRDSGYDIIDYFYTGGTIDLPSRSLKMSLARFPRKILFKVNQDLAVRTVGGYSLMVLAK